MKLNLLKVSHPRVVVLILGASLTVISAFLGQLYIKKNLNTIEENILAKSRINQQISELWQNQQHQNLKTDFTYILYSLQGIDQGETLFNYIKDTLPESKSKPLNGLSPENLLMLLKDHIQQTKAETLASINDKYLDVIYLDSEISQLKNSNEYVSTWALLLQILGLILVLSKDVFPVNRKQNFVEPNSP